MLPYIYSNAYQMNQKGTPLMHAIVFDYQDDENVYEIGDQYMFGDNLMVCPVTQKGAQTRSVYLPEGEWYDYWTGKKYSGKQYVHVVTPLDTMPVFAKAGSIIPLQPAMLYEGEKPIDKITLEIFPGADGSFELYEDDGKSLNYLNKEYSITSIKSKVTGGDVHVSISKPAGKYIPYKRSYIIKFHTSKLPTNVQVNQKNLPAFSSSTVLQNAGWRYDAREQAVYVHSNEIDSPLEILIR
jgi:alpha-glucosidase (family GH31 glycosyl hydrolase)